MTIIDLTPEEFRCAATMSCPRVLVRAACEVGASCPAVLEGKPDTLIIIGKVVLNNPEIDDMVGCGEDAVEIDRSLITQAVTPVLHARIAELEAALKPWAKGIQDEEVSAALDRLIRAGVQWGAVTPKTDAEHVTDFADTLRLTRENFGLLDEKLELHGIYLAGTEIVVCHTGTSPNSSGVARLIVGLIESTPRLIADARAVLASSRRRIEEPQRSEGDEVSPQAESRPDKALMHPEASQEAREADEDVGQHR